MENRTRRTAIIAAMLVITVLCAFALTGCSDSKAVGYWIVEKVTAGDVVMTEADASSIGLNAVGTIKLQKSGNCVVTILGEESDGKWKESEDGELTIRCASGLTLTGSIDEEGVMTLTDPQGAEYVLEK